MATTGQLASESLEAFDRIQVTVRDFEYLEPNDARDFIIATLGLMSTLPPEARPGYGANLPFSTLEREFLPRVPWHVQEDRVRYLVVHRLQGWVALTFYNVEGRIATCPAYLRRLSNFLERQEERDRAERLAWSLE
jgi:hypothetical protein